MRPTGQKIVVNLLVACIVAFTGHTRATEIQAEKIHINHDGMMRASTQSMSLQGIGATQVVTDDFSLFVRGQFRMLSSAQLTRQGRKLANHRPLAEPVWVSLVALGEIDLEIKGKEGDPSTFYRAKIAVYHVKDNRWVLDSKEIKPM